MKKTERPTKEGVKPSFRQAVVKHASQVVKEELPTIQLEDDPTNGEFNPMSNDEPDPAELAKSMPF